jgi:hypothetical protein
MAFQKSVNDLLLNLGVVAPNNIVQLTYGVSFTASLQDRRTLRFTLPYNPIHAGTTAFMDVAIDNDFGVRTAESPDYKSKFSDGRIQFGDATVKTAPSIIVKTAKNIASTAMAQMVGDEVHMALSIVPELGNQAATAAEVFFLLDTSGSMEGAKIEHAKRALLDVIHGLPNSHYFNVITFATLFHFAFPESRQVSLDSLGDIESIISQLSATGGTDLLLPLEIVYNKSLRNGLVRQIFLLTDGQVTGEAEILSLVAGHRANHRIFSLGIGARSSRSWRRGRTGTPFSSILTTSPSR